ncbi:hypothetical protein EJ06DRAFT_541702 [Trichodelitschia bisporula]|uniref:SH3 domain-containing protein n=1 Tax=Trichodelitschia bisporula TaxID=703511 RepID=A0A6G1I3U1_9PEZI|nr:hypothetical protein EJ06DRAFT_541702 [Trichodelitschia bisporula]
MAQPLPMKFPCWVKAIYSWGGETKRDLGFLEGDLIECLNAGDGSWWMGRLRRDRRMVGLFPSNFVEVLPADFTPGGSRNASPLPVRAPSATKAPVPQKSKSMFRKPFQAYYNASQPNPEAAKRELQQKTGGTGTPGGSLRQTHKPYSSMKKAGSNESTPSPQLAAQRSKSAAKGLVMEPVPRNGHIARAASPAPPPASYRAVSPAPPVQQSSYRTGAEPERQSSYRAHEPERHGSYRAPEPDRHSSYRAHSPAPPQNYARAASPAPPQHYARAASPAPPHNYARAASPAPPAHYRAHSPAPPAHYRAHSPAPPIDYRTASPAPPAHYRAHSPAPPQNYVRTASPAPPAHYRAHSPAPPPPDHFRAPSPAPSAYRPYSRGPSPTPYQAMRDGALSDAGWEREDSPPPPPPPPHRVFQPSRAPSPQPPPQFEQPRHLTPEPPSPLPGMTPSPLTNAMNDVMNCIEDMSLSQTKPAKPDEPLSVWSPEAFDEIYSTAKKARPQTSLGLEHQDSGYGGSGHDSPVGFAGNAKAGPPQVEDYVQRMERRLRALHEAEGTKPGAGNGTGDMGPPPPPPKNGVSRPGSPQESTTSFGSRKGSKKLKHRKSAYELGREMLGRTFTTKTSATSTTHSSGSTSHTLMSASSAGGISATSAGSLYRKKLGMGHVRPQSVMETGSRGGGSRAGYPFSASRPQTPMTGGVSYHSSHDSGAQVPDTPDTVQKPEWMGEVNATPSVLGGLATPRPRKSGFFKKMIETARTGTANVRSTISSAGSHSRPGSPVKGGAIANGITSLSGGPSRPQSSAAARDMGLNNAVDWVQVRRDVNRSNSLSRNERAERAERCQMLDLPVLAPVDILRDTLEGDEDMDGLAVAEPTDFNACNLALVDKSARFVNNLPPVTTPAQLVQGYLCRPYRSDVQRLRAIFTWVAERIAWEEAFEGTVDTRRVISTKRGCAEEVAVLVAEMCAAVGIHADVVPGYLKSPGAHLDTDTDPDRPNHFWNVVVADGEWRIMDCSLASPTHPARAQYSTAGAHAAEGWWFLARPSHACYTHVPASDAHQHLVPAMPRSVLLALPSACPPFFKHRLDMVHFDTSLLHLENLELVHVHFFVPEDVECVAEVVVRAFARDADGDVFESGDVLRRPALAQAQWIGGRKRVTVKALLPGDEGTGVLKIYAGMKGLMHSIKSNPHALALALPLTHTGTNPPYTFFTRHPTPHAMRHDLYVVQPQCARLALNNTFVFTVRQHPSSSSTTPDPNTGSFTGRASPLPARPTSALSMASVSASGSAYSGSQASSTTSGGQRKPAKLAVQAPGGKIIRLVRKAEHSLSGGGEEGRLDGSEWETVIKVGERGTWRGLVLADRTARWCVFAEWECV